MKSIFKAIIFVAIALQFSEALLKVTVFYETICPNSMNFFRRQLSRAYNDSRIAENIMLELVPFGHANFTEQPWSIKCQHGPLECFGNAVQGCFFGKNSDDIHKQITFAICTMSDNNPWSAGKKCAAKLGYDYEGIEECAKGNEGIAFHIKYGRRTLDFKPPITFIPTIVYNDVFNEKDQKNSLRNLSKVILEKLDIK